MFFTKTLTILNSVMKKINRLNRLTIYDHTVIYILISPIQSPNCCDIFRKTFNAFSQNLETQTYAVLACFTLKYIYRRTSA